MSAQDRQLRAREYTALHGCAAVKSLAVCLTNLQAGEGGGVGIFSGLTAGVPGRDGPCRAGRGRDRPERAGPARVGPGRAGQSRAEPGGA